MDLRDRFAARFAAVLVDAFPEAEEIARRAYDLAEAMLAERARRIDLDEQRALAEVPHAAPQPLLDEPMEAYEDEPPYDPSWDLDARWSAEPISSRPGPGLARTQPPAPEEDRKERSA